MKKRQKTFRPARFRGWVWIAALLVIGGASSMGVAASPGPKNSGSAGGPVLAEDLAKLPPLPVPERSADAEGKFIHLGSAADLAAIAAIKVGRLDGAGEVVQYPRP